jgi:hypothetical protein
MGCDIHLYVEVEVDGKWHTYNHPNVKRNYELFAKMAGVRNYAEIEPIVAPRGFPTDASLVCRLDYENWGIDAHTASYLNEKEIDQLVSWCKEQVWGTKFFWFEYQFGFLFGNSLYHLTEYKDDYPASIQAVRLVFWFDN